MLTERKMVLIVARMTKKFSVLFPFDPTDTQILQELLRSKFIEIERIPIDESVINGSNI